MSSRCDVIGFNGALVDIAGRCAESLEEAAAQTHRMPWLAYDERCCTLQRLYPTFRDMQRACSVVGSGIGIHVGVLLAFLPIRSRLARGSGRTCGPGAVDWYEAAPWLCIFAITGQVSSPGVLLFVVPW